MSTRHIMERIIKLLTEQNKKISTMESCTGGYIANQITNVSGSSLVFEFSAITYANEAKIKLGVKEETINKYSVYSKEVAEEMAFNIAKYSYSNIGVGVTGKLKRIDPNNEYGLDDQVFISIYNNDNNKYYNSSIIVTKDIRELNKKMVCDEVINLLIKILDK